MAGGDDDPIDMPSKRFLVLYAIGASSLPFLATLHVARTAQAQAAEVVIDDFEFRPATLRIAAGTRVVWVNRDGSPHNVVSSATPRVFRSRLMEAGERFEFTFATPGTYAYYCALHPHMQGRIEVA